MSTKSSQTGGSGRVPFQARHKVIVITVVILGIAWLAWNVLYTRVAANAPMGVQNSGTLAAPGAAPATAPAGAPATAPAEVAH